MTDDQALEVGQEADRGPPPQAPADVAPELAAPDDAVVGDAG